MPILRTCCRTSFRTADLHSAGPRLSSLRIAKPLDVAEKPPLLNQLATLRGKTVRVDRLVQLSALTPTPQHWGGKAKSTSSVCDHSSHSHSSFVSTGHVYAFGHSQADYQSPAIDRCAHTPPPCAECLSLVYFRSISGTPCLLPLCRMSTVCSLFEESCRLYTTFPFSGCNHAHLSLSLSVRPGHNRHPDAVSMTSSLSSSSSYSSFASNSADLEKRSNPLR